MRMPFGVERMMYGCAPVCAGAAFIAAMAAATVDTSKKPRRGDIHRQSCLGQQSFEI